MKPKYHVAKITGGEVIKTPKQGIVFGPITRGERESMLLVAVAPYDNDECVKELANLVTAANKLEALESRLAEFEHLLSFDGPFTVSERWNGWAILDAQGSIFAATMNRGRDMGETDAHLITMLLNSHAAKQVVKPAIIGEGEE